MRMDGVARYRPEHDVKLLTHGSFLVDSFLLMLILQSDRVEVCEGPGTLHDSESCRFHGQREYYW